MGSGCGCLIADFSFVCQTTPHFGSTSRKASYSVWAIIHEIFPFVKPFPDKSFNFYRIPPFYLVSSRASPERSRRAHRGIRSPRSTDSSTSHLRCDPQNDKEFLYSAHPFRGVSQPQTSKIIPLCTGGMPLMQCTKLKTYMETGRVVFLPPS